MFIDTVIDKRNGFNNCSKLRLKTMTHVQVEFLAYAMPGISRIGAVATDIRAR